MIRCSRPGTRLRLRLRRTPALESERFPRLSPTPGSSPCRGRWWTLPERPRGTPACRPVPLAPAVAGRQDAEVAVATPVLGAVALGAPGVYADEAFRTARVTRADRTLAKDGRAVSTAVDVGDAGAGISVVTRTVAIVGVKPVAEILTDSAAERCGAGTLLAGWRRPLAGLVTFATVLLVRLGVDAGGAALL